MKRPGILIRPFLFLKMENFKIRKATVADAARIAYVKYRGWQDTYRGIIIDAFLDAMNPDSISNDWQKILDPRNTRNSTAVMVNEKNEIIGFVSYGLSHNEVHKGEAEILALYVLKEYHGKGIGAMLFLYGINALKAAAFQSFFLYVLAQNPAVHFYRKFHPDKEYPATVNLGGNDYEEIGLVWNDISKVW
jgi:ribosomal protein S18 acetylase RimI-like enzyme